MKRLCEVAAQYTFHLNIKMLDDSFFLGRHMYEVRLVRQFVGAIDKDDVELLFHAHIVVHMSKEVNFGFDLFDLSEQTFAAPWPIAGARVCHVLDVSWRHVRDEHVHVLWDLRPLLCNHIVVRTEAHVF